MAESTAARLPEPVVLTESRASSRWREGAAAGGVALCCLVLSVVITFPIVRDPTHRLISAGDPVFQAWTIAWDIHAVQTAPRQIFDANIFYPYHNTLAYSDYLFGQAILVAPIFLVTHNPVLADNLATWLAFVLSGCAMALLVRAVSGSWLGGLVAGVAYMVAPARLAQIEHLHLLSAEWLPLAALTTWKAVRTGSGRWALGLGVVVLLQGLFGVYYLLFLPVLLVIVWAIGFLAEHSWRAVRGTLWAGVACSLSLVLLIPMLLPYWRVHQELGAERSIDEVVYWHARWTDYLAVPPENWLYGSVLAPLYHRHIERDLFPGVTVLFFALLGLFFASRAGWFRWAMLALLVVAVTLSFGPIGLINGKLVTLPYMLLYNHLPGFRAVRVPARFALLALVGLAALAGFGMATVNTWLGPRLRWLRVGVACLAVVALTAEGLRSLPVTPPLPVTWQELQRPDYAWLAAHPVPAIELPMADPAAPAPWPNFWSTFHWAPLVNGYSGITPPAYAPLYEQMRAFPSAETLHLLRGIGVQAVVYHADQSQPADRDPMVKALLAQPGVTQVVGWPDYVFMLSSDPWMWRLAEAVPAGAPVALPALARDPATFGLLAAILQRTGHHVYGPGTLGFWHIPAPGPTVCAAIVPDGSDPAGVGWAGATVRAREGGLMLLWRAECAA